MSIVVSVVIPTYKRPEFLARCVNALMQQDLDANTYEIIVCDDAADERTQRQAEHWAKQSAMVGGAKIMYGKVCGNHGPAAARNAGWRAAHGEFIAFIDDDCIPVQKWLCAGLAAFKNHADYDSTLAAVTGRIVVPLPPEPTDYERDASGLNRAEFATANCFCRRDALVQVDGFDERFRAAWREDSDMQFTLLRAGFRIAHAPHAVVLHPVRPAPWGISIRQQQKTMFNALLYKKHPELYRERIRSSPLWSYYTIVVSLFILGISITSGWLYTASIAAAIWCVLTTRFALQRLQETSRKAAHIAEMIVTSAVVPILSVFWTIVGAWRYRVLFF